MFKYTVFSNKTQELKIKNQVNVQVNHLTIRGHTFIYKKSIYLSADVIGRKHTNETEQ